MATHEVYASSYVCVCVHARDAYVTCIHGDTNLSYNEFNSVGIR